MLRWRQNYDGASSLQLNDDVITVPGRNKQQEQELKELIKDVPRQPEIVFGMDGMNEVAVHPDAEAVITGIVGCAGKANPVELPAANKFSKSF